MSATPEAVARDWFKQVWNDGSEAAIDKLLAVDAKMHGLSSSDGSPLVGPGDFKPFWRKFKSAFPDIRIDVARTVAEGDYVAVHCHVSGKHLGDGLGIAATQRSIDFWGMGIARIRGGQVVEAWNCFDFMSLYQQIGLLPAVGAV
jgi:predicted ester cyclase